MDPDHPDFNPYLPPEAPILAPEPGPEEVLPLPWEDHDRHPGFWQRVGGMFSLAFSRPSEFGTRVEAGEGLMRPWTFVLTLAAPLLALLLLVVGLLSVVFGIALRSELKQVPAWVIPLAGVAILVLAPLMYFVQMLVWGLINHACLWMWGGLRNGAPLEQSLRLTGYALAFFALGSMIPLVNYATFVAVPAVLGIAMARLHRTDTWRGVCAAFTPVLLCCCVYAIWMAVLIGVTAKA